MIECPDTTDPCGYRAQNAEGKTECFLKCSVIPKYARMKEVHSCKLKNGLCSSQIDGLCGAPFPCVNSMANNAVSYAELLLRMSELEQLFHRAVEDLAQFRGEGSRYKKFMQEFREWKERGRMSEVCEHAKNAK